MTFFQTLPTSAQIVAVLLLALFFAFITLFLLPSITQHLKLRRLNRALAAADKQDIKALSTLFENDDTLAHLWREYRDTLHPQKELNVQTASYDVVRYRSTIPAEAIFSREALVDSQLRTEFFKHLPGIFTGIGIIGTFWGLTKGLYAFHISEKSEEVRNSLESLLQGVREAFYISLTAIVLAMVCTAIEKWLVSGLYKRVEELCQRIDSMFDTGAGEEYLARLVRSSESSEKETKILKDALVTELKQILEGLTERQIQQASIQAETIANRIVNGLNDGLKEPLTKIGNAVEAVGGNQGDAVNRLLTDTMSALTAQMKDLFGDQISGINRLQQETIAALQGSLSRLDTLAEKMTTSGQTATEQMAKQMSDVIAGMDARQKVINAELMKAVSSIRADASDSQTETNRKMQGVVASLGARVTEMVQALQSQVDQASVRDQSRTEALTQHAQHTQAAMTASLDKTLTQVADVGESIKQAVARMEQVTMDVVARMNEGANTLYIASSDFAKAGEKTAETLSRADTLTGQLSSASNAVIGTANALSAATAEYKTVRDEVARLVSELKITVQSAKTEASLTSDVLTRIKDATQKLVEAQHEADHYLERVSGVLTNAHQSFAKNITDTLDKANSDFHQYLTRATKMLGQSIDELNDVFDRIPGK